MVIALVVLGVSVIGIAVSQRKVLSLWFRTEVLGDSDDELISSNRNGQEIKYTEADFPCPPAMPGRKSSMGGMFCDFEPKPGEVAFAVVQPDPKASEPELKALGDRLQAWKASNDQVRRILGLEQLLQGTRPEVRACMFSLAEKAAREYVALIYVTPPADNETTGEELLKAMKGLAVSVNSPGYFSMLRS